MIRIRQEEVKRWRLEINQAEEFRSKNFGVYSDSERTGAGENLDYFETGMSTRTLREFQITTPATTLNLIFPIVKNIIPSLYYKNPKVIALPRRKEDEASAPIAAEILNYYHQELEIKEVTQQIIFDAYVLGMGVCKIGNSTQFGADIPDEGEEKRREKNRARKIMEQMRLIKPKPEEKKENIDKNEYIRSESPYVIHISPFDFLIDPRAKSIHDAQWVAHKVTKTLKQVKENPNYSNTANLKVSELEESVRDVPETEIENFQPIILYEVWYKTDEGMNILTLAKDQEDYKTLRHEESIYEMDGFPFEILMLNKHGHKLYPISDISVVKTLQDRINVSFDSILDQVDRFVSKIFVDETKLTVNGKNALQDGELGSIVSCNANPGEVAKEFNMTQVKADMVALIERIVDMMSLKVGLTRAQLTGVTSAETATEAQIGQAGQNLRRSDQAEAVIEFVNRQSRKLWQVIAQFVDFEELQVITGEPMADPQGRIQYSWIQITPETSGTLIKGEYRFDIEVGSSQKPNIEVIRQQATNIINQAFNPVVKQLLAQEGTNLSLTELLRGLIKLFPEFIKNPERVLQQASQQQQMMASMPQAPPSGRGQSTQNTGAVSNMQRRPPTPTTIQEEVYGEQKGGLT